LHGRLCTPLKAGQDHFGDELLLGVADDKLLLCRLGERPLDEILANKRGLPLPPGFCLRPVFA
jgi:hypothetical protein